MDLSSGTDPDLRFGNGPCQPDGLRRPIACISMTDDVSATLGGHPAIFHSRLQRTPAHANGGYRLEDLPESRVRLLVRVPIVYDSVQSRAHCGLWEEALADGVVAHWGSRSTLAVFPSLGASAGELLSTRLSHDAADVKITHVIAGGVPGLKAKFRLGGLARFGEICAFESQGHGFAASYTAGPDCEPAGFSVLEPPAFEHAMQSLPIDP